jgi:hypothetical protein
MNKSRLFVPAATVLLGLSGCVTQPAPTAIGTSYVSELGDRSSVNFDEIVVSLPLSGSNAAYQNLHLVLAVAINPVLKNADAAYTSSPSSTYEIDDLVRRLGPRITATVSATLQDRSQAQLSNMSLIRKQAVSLSEAVLNDALRNWKYAADYKLEVLVLNSYWTDASVGRQPQATPSPRW